ncbi:hypothetical protein [Crenalkalicoccus roseus]|uniref:hypothetical protein n=1 Tax=Crenalkalicoccus roseus TaxID=1485588 RepID=UPI001080FD36|nr:hypothetical protein [Crenalkalicoccus roseus]
MPGQVLRKPCYGLAEICARWAVSEADLVHFVIAGELALSVVVVRLPVEEGLIEEVEQGRFAHLPDRVHSVTGTLDLRSPDAWEVLTAGRCAVRSFQAAEGRYRALQAAGDAAPELLVARERLVIRHDEVVRFEAAQAAYAASPAPAMAEVKGRGAPSRYDWDAFWCEAAVLLQIEGMPATQAALVRRMERWFAERGEFPDQRTIKRKVGLLWRRHAEALARLPG